MNFWILGGIITAIWILGNATLQLIGKIKSKNLDKQIVILDQKKLEFEQRELFKKYKQEVKTSLDIMLIEKAQGFPWLANAIADYYENFDKIFAEYLETKQRPAYIQAARIKEIAKEKKYFKKEFQTTKYIIEYYEALFPWLREYVGFNSDELIKSISAEINSDGEEDPVAFYITKSEFENLTVTERNQRALDRYWNRSKDPWQIGRDYERYIGYLYELKGFKVQYHGIEKLKDDLGRDLICTKGNQIEVIQCKYWSNQKGIPIRENHIAQLYGTTVKYFLDHKRTNQKIQIDLFPDLLRQNNIIPVLITTTDLSPTAKDFGAALGIKVLKIPMNNDYPCIKCNINFQSNDKIYHLPFDQQYDNTMIDQAKGEKWVQTIQEAEALGFRRAWKWKTNNDTV